MEQTITLKIETASLPGTVHGFSAKQPGRFYIVVNEADPPDRQAATFLHEMLHIWHDDHDSGRSADSIEQERHAEVQRLLSILNSNNIE